MVNCSICKREFESDANLHKHIKVHKLKLVEYYHIHYPRYDKLTNELIVFKNKEQYFATDFNAREHLRDWILTTDKPTVRAYMRHLLEKRKEKKNLIWTPCQVELKTTMLPPIQYYNDFFGNYYSLCEELGFKNRFSGKAILDTNFGQLTRVPPQYVIHIDTREQKPLVFENRESESQTLKFGDYACSESNLTCNLHVERKGAQDFVGTFSGGMERFCREVDRAVAAQAYIIVLVEESLSNCARFNELPHFYQKDVVVTPEFVMHNVRDIIQTYSNLQFLFVSDRTKAARTIEKLFDSNCSYKNVDLQFQYDIGQI